MDLLTILQILDSTLRLATPLLFACLAGLFSERSGIFDIGLEGKMLIAAFFSAAFAYTTGNVWLGMLAGIAGSVALAALHGVASVTFRGNQLISGVAINFLAAGFTQANILEVILGAAQKLMSNYNNHFAQTPVDQVFQKYAWSRTKAAAE